MRDFIARFLKNDSGATSIEYALMITMIAVVIVGAVGVLGGHARDSFQDAADLFK